MVAQGTNGPAYGDDEGTAKYVYEVIKPKYIGALALAQLFGGQIISLNADVMRGNYGFGGNMGNGGRRGGYGGIANNNRGNGWGGNWGNGQVGNWGNGGGNGWGGGRQSGLGNGGMNLGWGQGFGRGF